MLQSVRLEQLTIGTVFKFRDMTLRKSGSCGPCDPKTLKAAPFSKDTKYGRSCDIKLGGQWQDDRELQIWVPDEQIVVVEG